MNIGIGSRSIQYTSSDDFNTWKDFEVIKLIPEYKDGQNYYSPEISKYPDTNLYIGFPTYFMGNKKNSMRAKIIISNDIHNFYVLDDYLINPHIQSHNYCGNGFFEIDNKLYFYIFENPLTYKVRLTRYSIIKDRLISIHTDEEGYFKTKYPLTIENNNIIINFKTYEDGYIKFELYDVDNNVYKDCTFNNCETITGDDLAYKIKWLNNEIIDIDKVYIKCKIKNGDIFTISGSFCLDV